MESIEERFKQHINKQVSETARKIVNHYTPSLVNDIMAASAGEHVRSIVADRLYAVLHPVVYSFVSGAVERKVMDSAVKYLDSLDDTVAK